MARRFCSDELVFKALIIILGVAFVQCSLISGKNSSQVRRKINRLKRHSLRSIQSEDGDIIDCIDIYKQPAFDHPVLRKHTIQMAPSYDTSMGINVKETKTDALKTGDTKSVVSGFSQLWQKGGSCPKGTIPVRRIREMEVFKRDSVERYGRKNPSISSTQQANYSKAILLTEGYSYSGVRGDIKVWNPRVEADDEYSTSQVSLKSGPYYFFESIETGWAVNPGVYGDRQTRLFVYWTADASNKTGCFDLTCPGFVQTSNEIALGSAIYPLSVPGGLPYQITIYIFKDPNTGNWWVQYGEKINIGYWPPELFSMLHYGNAECAEWGGEVFSSRVGQSPHTATAMGNGQFPDFVTGNSGVIRRLRIRENSIDLKFPEWVATYTDEFNCYDAYYVGDYTEDPEFYYGGPGKSPRCP